jgi:hypothetical protein
LSYQAEISRTSPTAIVMVMDQPASMNHRLKSGQSKAAFLADVLNKTLYTLLTSVDVGDRDHHRSDHVASKVCVGAAAATEARSSEGRGATARLVDRQDRAGGNAIH